MKAALTLALLATLSAHAANHYVDSAATGAGTGGTWTDAWTSFAAVNWTIVQPGETIFVSGGPLGGTNTYTSQLSVGKSGTSDALRITIRAGQDAGHNGVVRWAMAAGGSGIQARRNFVTIDGEYLGARHFQLTHSSGVLRENTVFDGYGSQDIHLRYLDIAGVGIGINCATLVRGEIDHCFLHDIRGDVAIRLTQGNPGPGGWDLTFVHDNEIQLNCDMTGNGAGPDGIQGCEGLTAYNNHFYHALGSLAIDGSNHSDFIQSTLSMVTVRGNWFQNATDSSFDQDNFAGGPNGYVRIYNNVFSQDVLMTQPTGIRIYSSAAPITSLANVWIENNTFVDYFGSINGRCVDFGFNGGNATVTNVHVRNNVFYNCSHGSVVINSSASTAAVASDYGVDYNLLNAATDGSATISLDGSAYLQPHPNSGTPAFVAYSRLSAANNYHLSGADTAAYNRGTVGAFATDKDGVLRPQNTLWDIGAYERLGSLPAPPKIRGNSGKVGAIGRP